MKGTYIIPGMFYNMNSKIFFSLALIGGKIVWDENESVEYFTPIILDILTEGMNNCNKTRSQAKFVEKV